MMEALAGCGVPREAGMLAAQNASVATTMPAGDDAVRAQLAAQADAWGNLSGLMHKNVFGGITGVDARFVELVDETAAIAKRQRDLISQGKDDPAFDRQALER